MDNWKKALKHLCVTALLLLGTEHLCAQCDWSEVTPMRRYITATAKMGIDVNQNLIVTWRKTDGFGIGDTFVSPPADFKLHAFTASIDPALNVNWVQYFVDQDGEGCLMNPSHVLGDNGDIYVLGQIVGTCQFVDTSYTYTYNDATSLLLKLNSQGQIQWKRPLDGNFSYYTPLLLLDTVLYLYNTGDRVKLISATTGNDIGDGDTLRIVFDQLNLTDDGKVLFTTSDMYPGNDTLILGPNILTMPLDDQKALVVKYDLSGSNVLWYDVVISGDLYLQLGSTAVSDDGSNYVAGNFRDTLALLNSGYSYSQPGYMGNFLIKYNSAGVMQWVEILNMRLIQGYPSQIRIVDDEQLGLYFGVEVQATTDIFDISIPLTANGSAVYGQIDQFGDLEWHCNIAPIGGKAEVGGVYQDHGLAFFSTFVRGVAYIGQDTIIETQNGFGVYVFLELDSTFGITNIIEEELTELNAFPNPTTDYTYIQCDNLNYVEAYDTRGRKLLTSRSNAINLTNIKPGIIIFKIFDHSGNLTVEKVVKI